MCMRKEANLYFHLVYSILPKLETSVLRSLRTKNSRLVHMLDTTYRLNHPGVQMTSDIFYQGNLAPAYSNKSIVLGSILFEEITFNEFDISDAELQESQLSLVTFTKIA